jgi:pimeloyl-ACP methyl ester carboxylesterase
MTPARRYADESVVLIDGPWTHRDVSANGIRLHAVESGAGPLVILLHGFPEFWWSWRHQLSGLADAGFRAVACDLRGYGGSDKPPRGYDAMTAAADVAGLVRALGENDAIIVGHDWGGHIGWTTAALYPSLVRCLVVISDPHPLRWLPSLATDSAQRRASRHVARFQLPWHPERWLVEDDAANVAMLLRRWSGPHHAFGVDERRYRDAMLVLGAPHCALEYFRWAVRSVPRADGRRFRRALRQPLGTPTLQLHGDADTCVLPASAQGSGKYVAAPYEWHVLEGVGHFPPEETPDVVTGEIVRWAKQ